MAPAASADEARAAIEAGGFGWSSVVDDGELLGWVDRDLLDGKAAVAETSPAVHRVRHGTRLAAAGARLDRDVADRGGGGGHRGPALHGDPHPGTDLPGDHLVIAALVALAGVIGRGHRAADPMDWIGDHLDEIVSRGLEHLYLTVAPWRSGS